MSFKLDFKSRGTRKCDGGDRGEGWGWQVVRDCASRLYYLLFFASEKKLSSLLSKLYEKL